MSAHGTAGSLIELSDAATSTSATFIEAQTSVDQFPDREAVRLDRFDTFEYLRHSFQRSAKSVMPRRAAVVKSPEVHPE